MVDTAFPDGPPKPPEPAKPEAAAKPEATDCCKRGSRDEGGRDNSGIGEARRDAGTDWLKASAQPINIVVVADTDMLDDRFWMQNQDFFGQRIAIPTANNGDFVANAVEVLAGGNDLVGLRSRGTSARPFQVVDRIERDAQERYSAEERALQQKLKDTQAKLTESHRQGSGERARDPLPRTGKDDRRIPRRYSADPPPAAQCAVRFAQRYRAAEGRAGIPQHRADSDHRRGGRCHPRCGAPEAAQPPRCRSVIGNPEPASA